MRTPGILLALLVPTLAGAALPAHAAHSAAAIRVAPADEYFGRLKMSILGIRNQLRDLGLRLQYSPQNTEAVLGSAAFVEDAMRDWEHKYPADPWLAKSVYQLTDLYSRVHTVHGHRNAARALRWLLSRYGRTPYGHLARLRIVPQVGLR
jgi:hypothetical protein